VALVENSVVEELAVVEELVVVEELAVVVVVVEAGGQQLLIQLRFCLRGVEGRREGEGQQRK